MNHETGEFEGAGGVRLFYQVWRPEGAPRAVLALVHGVNEHCGRYQRLAEGLPARGFAVMGFDHRGHGRSAGRRGHVDDWADYRGDLLAFLQHVRARLPGVPLFLYGHSMGSLVVLDFLAHYPEGLAGAIVSGAAVEPAGVGSSAQRVIARVLSALVPTFSLNVPIESEKLTRDPAAIEAHRTDPMVGTRLTARWGTETMDVIERIKAAPEVIRLPVLFLHGEADPLNLASGARAYFDRLASADKRFVGYPGGLHEPHNDTCCAEVVDDVARWIGERLRQPDAASTGHAA
jgi:alpha-beta hydrolase superfamily lysophospholipase